MPKTHAGLALTLPVLLLALGAGGPPGTQGSYKITFAGALHGSGNAAVGAQQVNINAQVDDDFGNSVHIVAPGLDLTDGRFNGTGNYDGQTAQFSGRIEAPDGQVLKVARLSCLITLPNGTHARAIGSR